MNYNPLLPEVMENPYPYYAYLRSHAPVYKVEQLNWWAISRYDDILAVVKDYQRISNANYFPGLSADTFNPMGEAPAIVELDPPDHTRIRKLANRAFTPRIVASLEPRVRAIAQELLSQAFAKGTFDLIGDFAIPLPVWVIAELLGIEPERRDDFKRWADTFSHAIGGKTADMDPHQQQDLLEYRAYFEDVIERRRKEPQADLISALVKAQEEEQRLTAAEVFSLAVFLLLAGSETTTNLIGNAVLALLKHPEELAKVRANPGLLPNTIEEALRYDSPVSSEFRQMKEDVTIHGTTIPAGAKMLVLYGSANRDEAKFVEPQRFNVTRSNAQENLAFGYGIHFCLGAPLARREALAALEALLPHLPHLSWQESQLTRNTLSHQVSGLASFPMALRGF